MFVSMKYCTSYHFFVKKADSRSGKIVHGKVVNYCLENRDQETGSKPIIHLKVRF
jgi:hypothetical protein